GWKHGLGGGGELWRGRGEPLVNETAALLGELLPITDVAQAIIQSEETTTGSSAAGSTPGTGLPATFCLDAATPLVRTDPQIPTARSRSDKAPSPTFDFLLIPA